VLPFLSWFRLSLKVEAAIFFELGLMGLICVVLLTPCTSYSLKMVVQEQLKDMFKKVWKFAEICLVALSLQAMLLFLVFQCCNISYLQWLEF
jgi:hypothetical protein